ncbi:MAG: large conductance mechanosensitive channel protein MscL [Clostridia bacterium]|nr:large conductance mechanosensitive channel protein MscL [Clostridia bacterium]
MKKFFGEFKEFIMRGNVMDMAVGVIIGAAFKAIIDSVVGDILMPVLSLITGGIDFQNWFVALDGGSYATLEAAQEAGAATLAYGNLISVVINFLIMAFVIFLIVKAFNKAASLRKKKEVEEEPTTKTCPFCCSEIDIKATKCPHCTSDLPEDAE